MILSPLLLNSVIHFKVGDLLGSSHMPLIGTLQFACNRPPVAAPSVPTTVLVSTCPLRPSQPIFTSLEQMQRSYEICVSANGLSASYEILISGLYFATGQRRFVVINTHAYI